MKSATKLRCVWTRSEGQPYYETSCNDHHNFEEMDREYWNYNYCPYCGGKNKEVEK